MKNTEIIFVIDKSSSMSRLTNDTIEGFNGFKEGLYCWRRNYIARYSW